MGIKVKARGDLRTAVTNKTAAIRRGLVRAVADETEAIAADMRTRAPIGDPRRGKRGRPPLRESIDATSSGLRGRARARARHGNIIEHGTKNRPAEPFVKPAAEASRRRFPRRVTTEVRRETG